MDSIRLFCLLSFCTISQTAHIAIVPFAYGVFSLKRRFEAMGAMLCKNGHDVTYIIPDDVTLDHQLGKGEDVMSHAAPQEAKNIYRRYMQVLKEQHKHVGSMTIAYKTMEFLDETTVAYGRGLFKASVVEQLQQKRFDLLVGHAADMLATLLAKRLNVTVLPYLSAGYMPNWFPSTPSVTPLLMSNFTDDMTFWQRFQNFVGHVAFHTFLSSFVNTLTTVVAKVGLSYSVEELTDTATKSLILVHSDLASDYSRPLPPHVFPIGGLFISEPKPLDPDTDVIMSQRKGVIVVSFGTNFGELPPEKAKILADSFATFPDYTFIWRYTFVEEKTFKIPNNVVIKTWIPQVDLLADNRTKLFIS